MKAVGSFAARRQTTVSRRRRFRERKVGQTSRQRQRSCRSVQGLVERVAAVGPRGERGHLQHRGLVVARGGHAVGQHQRPGGDRAGLVRHDAGDAADVLHRDGTPHQGLLASKSEDTDAEEERVDHRELLGQRSHSQRDGAQQGVDPTVALPEPHCGEHGAHRQRHTEQNGYQRADGLLQRRRGVAAFGGGAGDLAVARLAADASDAQPGQAGQQPCAGGAPVLLGCAGSQRRGGIEGRLGHRQRLARQRRFVDLQSAAGHQQAVRGEVFARRHFDQVARDQLARRDVLPLSIAQHPRRAGQPARQPRGRGARASMQVGVHAQQRRHRDEQRHRFGDLAQQGEQARRQHQEPQHRIACRVARDDEPAAGGVRHDVVKAIGALDLDLCRAQAFVARAECGQPVEGHAAQAHGARV